MKKSLQDLARKKRRILKIVSGLGRASAAEVFPRLADPPGYSTVQKMPGILEDKGYVKRVERNRVGCAKVSTPAAGGEFPGTAHFFR